ncbi:MAG: hypothetical protein CM15mP23_18490 [Cryomorphaceae bacterium]|nr:MAG: hypothetical protein CM15mP23_18490 [Cryomorphaceae bacterium]
MYSDIDSDGVCDELEVSGCTDSMACNTMAGATQDNGSCQYAADYYDCDGNCILDMNGDGVCDELEVSGCTDSMACNYNSDLTLDEDNSLCEYAENYYNCDGNCILDDDGDGVCDELEVVGCNDETASNYDASATNSGDCEYLGCTDETAFNYDEFANTDDGSCEDIVHGCMNPNSYLYDPSANVQLSIEEGGCEYPGCMDDNFHNYNENANWQPANVCGNTGCTNPFAHNYDSSAITDDGTCVPYIEGCMDESAVNYDANANTDDESCIPVIEGCMDVSAFNYDPTQIQMTHLVKTLFRVVQMRVHLIMMKMQIQMTDLVFQLSKDVWK